jgi:5'-3' exoribonuclease 1
MPLLESDYTETLPSLESINFYLLHLSLMREYLDLEFRDIEPVLPFDYSLERVIDDFILLAVFVGNDFLPNLPDLHIHENGLEKLFDVYKKVLPGMGKLAQSFLWEKI